MLDTYQNFPDMPPFNEEDLAEGRDHQSDLESEEQARLDKYNQSNYSAMYGRQKMTG